MAEQIEHGKADEHMPEAPQISFPLTLQSLVALATLGGGGLALVIFLLSLQTEVQQIGKDLLEVKEDLRIGLADMRETNGTNWRRTDMVIFTNVLQERANLYSKEVHDWLRKAGVDSPAPFPSYSFPSPDSVGIR